MSTTYSPSGVKTKVFTYEEFMGLDASRDKTALDTGEKQHLVGLKNGYADWRGIIVRDPGANQRIVSDKSVKPITFFGRDLVCWAQREGGGMTLNSDRGHAVIDAYPRDNRVTSTVFNKQVIFASREQEMYQYNGYLWYKNEAPSKPSPAYVTSIQRRLVIAGLPGQHTVVELSRVDDETIFPADEDIASTAVTKASDLDVTNLIGTSDEIRGLGVFETNRLVVFTHDKGVVYTIDPDYSKWALDEKSSVNVGTISHNTIATAGADMLFCSRDGVHSLRRSDANGIMIYTIPMSSKIDLTYRELLRSVADHEDITAYYDQDNGQYHIFFPQSEMLCTRLTLTLNPIEGGESKWSTSDFLNAGCGATLGGVTVLGTPGGVWNRLQIEDSAKANPTMTVTTPILWQGALNLTKESFSFVLQAAGKGEIQVEAFDEKGRYLSSMQFSIEEDSKDDSFPDVPLYRQYERKFEHRYRGCQFRFTTKGSGLLKIIGFAVIVRS